MAENELSGNRSGGHKGKGVWGAGGRGCSPGQPGSRVYLGSEGARGQCRFTVISQMKNMPLGWSMARLVPSIS